jgi:hypothetical protein
MSAPASAIIHPANNQTGPRTAIGKEISSNNALRHGGASNKPIVPGENPADFEALLNSLTDDYRPDTEQSRLFVENLATAHWLLARRQRACNAVEAAVYGDQPDEAQWTDAHHKRLALANRYKVQAERSLKRALNNLEGLQKWSRAGADRERRREQWAAEQAIRERRMTLQEQNFELAKSRAAERAFRSAKNAVSSPERAELNSAPADPIEETDASTRVHPGMSDVRSTSVSWLYGSR